MILGVGTDFIEKKRVEKILKKYGDRFINKILSDSEKKNFSSIDKTKKVNFLTLKRFEQNYKGITKYFHLKNLL